MNSPVAVVLGGVRVERRIDRRLVPPGAIPIPLRDLGSESGPNAAVLRLIHRAPDGFVPLAIKSDDEWYELGAVQVGELLGFNARCQLHRDAYFGINSSYRTGMRPSGTRRAWRRVPPNHPTYGNAALDFPGCVELVDRIVYRRINSSTGLPFAQHEQNSLRWLNANFIDLDCYRMGLSVTDALEAILQMQERGELPPPTMFACSGRGLWCVWLLLDVKNRLTSERTVFGVKHGPMTPQRASRWALATYDRVQRALCRRLQHLGADSQALDATRFGPVPGTLKTEVGTGVEYWMQETNGFVGAYGFAYTLPVLEKALGIEFDDWVRDFSEPSAPTVGRKRPERVESGRKGWFKRWQFARADLEILLRLRGGGFDRGCRNRGAFYYALVMTRAGVPTPEIGAKVTAVGRRSRPPLRASEIRGALRQAQRDRLPHTRWLSNRRILDDLAVTPEEAENLCHLSRVRKSRRPSRRRNTHERLVTIRTIVEEYQRRPSLREMVKLLKSRGIVCAPETVRRDYSRLNNH